ncbi:MAG: polymer-forming cytoskeletal protein [Croceitalea sp.]|nr:polymer-forming cytoskeletal protein [Croceitalea sp.]
MKKLTTLLLLFFAFWSFGQSVENEEISIDQVQPDDVYRAGEEINVNATIQGDLVIAGGTLKVNDSIQGDFNGAGGELFIKGHIADDVRVAGGRIIIDSEIGDDLVVFGGEVDITQNARINGKLICYGGDVTMDGEVIEAMKVRGGEVFINGTVRGTSKLAGEEITIGTNAKFHKDVQYWQSDEELDFKNSLVNAKAEFNEELAEDQSQMSMTTFGTSSLKSWIFYVLSAFLGILVFHALFRHSFENAAEGLENNLLKSFGYGLIYLVGIPLLILIALLMLIGLKLGLFATAIFVFSLLFGHAIASILIAYYLSSRYNKAWEFWPITFVALAAVIVMRLLTIIPYAGILVSVVVLAITYGALTLQIFRAKKERLIA